MRKLFVSIRLFMLSTAALVTPLVHAQAPSYKLVSAPLAVEAPLAVDTTTAIPGHTLKPGTYSIRIVDHLKDRYILQVQDTRGKRVATLIGLRDPQLNGIATDGAQTSGTIAWANAPGNGSALRGFSFPNGVTVEFVYPKAEAVELAQRNASGVPAIDPESEGRKASPDLSDEDRDVVTLWMLQATSVGPGKGTPAIEAKRFAATADAGTEVARNEAPTSVRPESGLSGASAVPAGESGGERTAGRHSKGTAVAAKLPQTASDFPMVLLVSGLLLGTGFGSSAVRRMVAGKRRVS